MLSYLCSGLRGHLLEAIGEGLGRRQGLRYFEISKHVQRSMTLDWPVWDLSGCPDLIGAVLGRWSLHRAAAILNNADSVAIA